MSLKMQTPPSANLCNEYVHAFLLLSCNTMIALGQCTACASSDVQAGRQVGKAHAAFDRFRLCHWDSMLCTLQLCWSALWLHGSGSGLLSSGFQHAPSVHSQDSDSSVPGPFIWRHRWVLCPQIRLSDSSGSKVSKLSLRQARCTYSPSRQTRFIWLGKETMDFCLIMKDALHRIPLLRLQNCI